MKSYVADDLGLLFQRGGKRGSLSSWEAGLLLFHLAIRREEGCG